MQLERRRAPRSVVALDVTLLLPGRTTVMTSRVTDLSVTGTFVRSIRGLEPGSRIQIGLDRGRHRNPLRMEAEVVRVALSRAGEPQGLGLRFLNLTDADQIALEGIIVGN